MGARPGARVVVLPAIPYGTETNQMRFPMAMNLNPSTMGRVIADLVESLEAHGITRCVILNGHGGNDLKWVLRELHRSTKVHLFLCNWYKMISDCYSTIFREKDDHAGEMETSMGLAHFPGLVAMDRADPGSVRPSRFEAINRGWVEITRPWHLLTTNSGAGDPRAASAAKGEALTELVAERIGGIPPRAGRQPDRRHLPFLRPRPTAGTGMEIIPRSPGRAGRRRGGTALFLGIVAMAAAGCGGGTGPAKPSASSANHTTRATSSAGRRGRPRRDSPSRRLPGPPSRARSRRWTILSRGSCTPSPRRADGC